MGGLISLYAGLTEPDIFGKLMVFSPSLWMSKKIFFEAKAFRPRALSRIYLYAGGKESKNHLRNVKKLCSVLIGKIHDAFYFDLEISVNEEGEHAESFWREEFPQAITWLFFNFPSHFSTPHKKDRKFPIYPFFYPRQFHNNL